MSVSVRKSNFELLRILAILLIVASHLFEYVPADSDYGTFVNIFSYSGFPGSWIGVDLFFMISGYFLIFSEKSQNRKLFSLLIQIYECFFISVVIFFVARFFGFSGNASINLKKLLGLFAKNCIYPLTSVNYWFITTYFILILFSPLLNGFLRRFSSKGFILFLIFCGLFWYLVSNIFSYRYSHIQRAVFFYSLGAFIKKNYKEKAFSAAHVLCLFSAVVLYLCATICYYRFSVMPKDGFRNEVIRKTLDLVNLGIFVPVICVLLFKFFERLPVPSLPAMNALGGTTLSVYLLHCNPLFISVVLGLLPLMNRFQHRLYPLLNLLGVVSVFLISAIVELARKEVHKRLLETRINDLYDRIRLVFISENGEER